jgi:O-antigen/teichoic acid export membrane protein
MKEKIIRNTKFSGLHSLVRGGVGFFLLPFMIFKVGPIEYGLVAMANIFAMSGVISLLELGFQSAIAKYVAEYQVKQDREKISQTLSTSLLLFFSIGILLMMIGLLFSNILAMRVLKISLEYQSSFSLLLKIVFFSYLFQFPTIVYAGFFEGLQRFDVLKTIQIITFLATALSIIVLLILGYGYYAIMLSTLGFLFLQFLAYIYFAFKVFPGLKVGINSLSKQVLKEIWPLAKLLSTGKVASFIYYNIPTLLISVFLGPIVMTSYDVIMKMPRLIKSSFGFINSAIMPAASELNAKGQKETLSRLFLRGTHYQLFFLLPIVTALIFFAKDFLRLWAGDEFEHLTLLLQIVLLWNIAAPLTTYANSILLGMNAYVKNMTILSIISTTLNVGIVFLFIRRYQLDAVVVGYVLGVTLMTPFFLRLVFIKLNIEFWVFMKKILSLMTIALLPLFAAIIGNNWISFDNLAALGCKVAIWCLVYWVGLYFLSMDKKEKRNIKDLFIMCKKLSFS